MEGRERGGVFLLEEEKEGEDGGGGAGDCGENSKHLKNGSSLLSSLSFVLLST